MMSEASGYKLSHWHREGGESQSSPELSNPANVLRALVTHTCWRQSVLVLSASGTWLRENLQLSLVLQFSL